MGRIVLYKGQSQYDVLRIFTDQLAEAFRLLQQETVVVDLIAADAEEQLQKAFARPCDFVFSFNGIGIDFKLGEKSLYDALGTVFVFSLVDDPLHHIQRLETPCNNVLVTCVDRYHTNIMPYLNQYRTFGFLPHGGCIPKNGNDNKEGKRDLDILFSGSFREPEEYYQIWKEYPLAMQNILEDTIENALGKENKPLAASVQEVIAARNLYLDPHLSKNLLKILPLADRYLRMKRRKECLEVLAKAGFKVKIYGNGWDKADFAKNFEVYPAINFNNLLEIIVKSKIVLNIVPSFVEGSHERVFTAMLNGAVAVTDRNTYYEKEFAEDKNIVMYSWGRLNELPDKIYDLLKNEEKRIKIAEEGYKEATKKHTWTVRALSIIQMVEAFKSLRAIQ